MSTCEYIFSMHSIKAKNKRVAIATVGNYHVHVSSCLWFFWNVITTTNNKKHFNVLYVVKEWLQSDFSVFLMYITFSAPQTIFKAGV